MPLSSITTIHLTACSSLCLQLQTLATKAPKNSFFRIIHIILTMNAWRILSSYLHQRARRHMRDTYKRPFKIRYWLANRYNWIPSTFNHIVHTRFGNHNRKLVKAESLGNILQFKKALKFNNIKTVLKYTQNIRIYIYLNQIRIIYYYIKIKNVCKM